jgi:hypothetical protein
VTLAAQNVVLITNYSGLEQRFRGIDNNLYPRPITFTLGLNVNFNTNNKKNEKDTDKIIEYFFVTVGAYFHHVPVI